MVKLFISINYEKSCDPLWSKDGVTGKWQSSVTKSGFVTRDTMLDILADLVAHVQENQIQGRKCVY